MSPYCHFIHENTKYHKFTHDFFFYRIDYLHINVEYKNLAVCLGKSVVFTCFTTFDLRKFKSFLIVTIYHFIPSCFYSKILSAFWVPKVDKDKKFSFNILKKPLDRDPNWWIDIHVALQSVATWWMYRVLLFSSFSYSHVYY